MFNNWHFAFRQGLALPFDQHFNGLMRCKGLILHKITKSSEGQFGVAAAAEHGQFDQAQQGIAISTDRPLGDRRPENLLENETFVLQIKETVIPFDQFISGYCSAAKGLFLDQHYHLFKGPRYGVFNHNSLKGGIVMYHAQHAEVSYHEMNFSAVWRKIANFCHKLGLAVIESKRREAERLLAHYRND